MVIGVCNKLIIVLLSFPGRKWHAMFHCSCPGHLHLPKWYSRRCDVHFWRHAAHKQFSVQSKQLRVIDHIFLFIFLIWIEFIFPQNSFFFKILIISFRLEHNTKECVVNKLKACSDPTPANIIEGLLDSMLKETPCYRSGSAFFPLPSLTNSICLLLLLLLFQQLNN